MMKLRNLTEREKLGYRDGVEEGKNSSVQEGFNEGYREAAIAGFNWGVARGITRSVLKPFPPPSLLPLLSKCTVSFV
jgi:flagellar biosynthesis/type III secretory pathway protein FliH